MYFFGAATKVSLSMASPVCVSYYYIYIAQYLPMQFEYENNDKTDKKKNGTLFSYNNIRYII